MSVDSDLFSNRPFENAEIVHALENIFGSAFDNRSSNPRFGIFCFVDEVKIDIVCHPHPLIRPKFENDGVRMFSTEDIVTTKVQAILGRAKKKDFWDIAELLNYYTVADFINFHKKIYYLKLVYHRPPSHCLLCGCQGKRRPD
jgi:predicted nucleotidyltransferase component of viral defense system